MAVARYGLAVDRAFKCEGDQQTADFPNCVAFGRQGEFAEKYLHKGTKVIVEGRLQTGSYTNRDGQKVYTTDVIVERHEFAESRAAANNTQPAQWSNPQMPEQNNDEGFIDVTDSDMGNLPFD